MVAQIAWAGDGIIEQERLLLEKLASLARDYPELAVKVAAYPWMNTPNGVSAHAHLGVEAIWLAAAVDAELAEMLAGYRWLQDGISSVEANALSRIADLAGHDLDTANLLASFSGFASGDAIEHVSKGAGHLSGILETNPALGRQVAAYPWIEDGITRIEARALAGIDELLRTSGTANSGLAEMLTGYPWVADGITAVEIKALDDFRVLLEVAERANSGLAGQLAGHSWVADGITSEELEGLRWFEDLLDVAQPGDVGFVEKLAGFSWVTDGVTSDEQDDLHLFWRWLHFAQGSDSAFLEMLATYSWVGDGLTPEEWRAIDQLLELLEAAEAVGSNVVEKIVGYTWIRDGITGDELDALYISQTLLESAGDADSGLAEKVLSYPWVADGISVPEPDAINRFRDLMIAARAVDSDVDETIADYSWVADGITAHEMDVLYVLLLLIENTEAMNFGMVESLAGSSWVSDGVTPVELGELNGFRSFPVSDEMDDPDPLTESLDYAWISDGITDDERHAIYQLRGLIDTAEGANSGAAGKLTGYSWVADGLDRVELDTLYIFQVLLETDGTENSAYAERVASYPWVADGITVPEPDDINTLAELLRLAGAAYLGLAGTLAEYPWVADGIAALEKSALREILEILATAEVYAEEPAVTEESSYVWVADCPSFRLSHGGGKLRELLAESGGDDGRLVEETLSASWLGDGIQTGEVDVLSLVRQSLEPRSSLDSVTPVMAGKLADYPWAEGGVTAFECSALDHFRALLYDSEAQLSGVPWFDDGIDDEELALMSVLRATKWRSVHQYEDLRDSYNVRSKTISLPLAGDVKLLVFRHSPFPARDDSIELMEDIARALEEFISLPFPWKTVVVGIIEPSLRAGEKPQRGVGYALRDQLAITGREYNRGFDLAVFHEMSHIYWGGHTGAPAWFTEGAAGFLPDYAREQLGRQRISSRRLALHQVWEDECRVWGAGTISKFLSMRDVNPERHESRGICTYALGEFFLLETYQLFGRDAASAAMRELYSQAEATGWTEAITEEQIYRVYRDNAPPGKAEAFQALYERYHGGVYDGG